MRVLPARDDALLVEVDDLDQAVALLESLADDPVPGVGEPVPGARTLLVPFRPSAVSARVLAAVLRGRPLVRRSAARSRRIEIPTAYDGADLADAADLLGWSPEELLRRHSGLDWVVGFMGFAPGFAYLTPVPEGAGDAGGGDGPAWADVPRRPTPRTHVPAGSVALAGRYSGVYPRVSPGGWQLVGRTDAPMWDTDRDPAALWEPGDLVRFVPVRATALAGTAPVGASAALPGPAPARPRAAEADGGRALEVVAAGAQALVQDLGRPGLAHLGVSASGALDAVSLRAANRAVGNPAGAAGLEVVGGVRLRARRPQVVALAGAVGDVVVRPRDGSSRTPATGGPGGPVAFALDDGDELRVAAPARGARTYLAVRGGVDVPAVLGSRATDVLADLGPAPLAAGDVLPVGAGGPGLPAASVSAASSVPAPRTPTTTRPVGPDLPAPGDVVTLRLVPGPRHDWFGDPGLAALAGQEWEVTPRSNRVGLRLAGTAIPRLRDGELPSEGCVVGAVQVPPDGLPVLFLADHPLTGGYPVIGAVASDQVPLLGQLPVGARLRFVPDPGSSSARPTAGPSAGRSTRPSTSPSPRTVDVSETPA